MTQKWKTNQTTSKIYKQHINGNPKRPGTHQYPHLGPKGCCGGRKTRSNCRPTLFLSYLSNNEESAKRHHGNEFRGSKNGGNEVWVGLKWPQNIKIRLPKFAAAAAFAGPIRVRPAAAGREILPAWSSGRPPPPWPAHLQCWWPKSLPRMKPDRPKNGQNDLVWGFRVFGIFSWVLVLDPHLATKTRLI